MKFADRNDAMARVRGKAFEKRVKAERGSRGFFVKWKAVHGVNNVRNSRKFGGQTADEARL